MRLIALGIIVAIQCALAAETTVPADAVPAARALLASGAWESGTAKIADGRLQIGSAGVPVEQVVVLRFPGAETATTIDQGVIFRNGDVLVGTITSLQSDKLIFVSDLLGTKTIAGGVVEAVALAPCALASLGAPGGDFLGVELTNGDRVVGAITWINEQTVGVNNGKRIVQVPRERAALVRLTPSLTATPAATGARQFARLASGDRLSGTAKTLGAEALDLDGTIVGAAKVPRPLLRTLWSEGGALTPLSALKPAEVKEVPQFDEHFPVRSDRNLLGEFLVVAGQRSERGLGCHVHSELDYELADGITGFVSEVGIDGASGRRGGAVFKVVVDGKPVAESGVVRGGEAAKTLVVPLVGAKHLRLVADLAPGIAAAGGHADWVMPVLVRGVAFAAPAPTAP